MMKYISGLIILLLVACSDLHKSEQLQSIQSMQKSIDSVGIVLAQHPIKNIIEIEKTYLSIEKRIQMNITINDTIDLAFGKKLDALKRAKLYFQPLQKTYSQLSAILTKEKVILNDLKSDIEGGNGDRAVYQKNIDFETKKVKDLQALLLTYTKQRDEALKTFFRYKDEMENFAVSLEHN